VRRQLAGAALAVVALPLLTLLLTILQPRLNLSDDLLIYLVAVVAITVVGGFWPALFAAIAASLLLNWYFTEPLHNFTIAEPRNLLALVLFVTVTVAVSSVVHLAARRSAYATKAAQAEALAEGNRMREALLRAVSHDLRTPLASIKASVSSLRQTDVTWSASDEADFLATIESNADRLDELVGNLLDLSRLRTGSIAPFLRATSVDEVAPLALRGLDGAEALRIVVPDDLPLVLADPGLLERVLANLFSNALRYSPPDQPPSLRAALSGPETDRVLLEIIDRGPGVPDALKEELFEPFRRLDERSSVGLGLAVARGFAEAMGGTITPLDTRGGGLTMRVSLPAQASGDRIEMSQP
jgi:two-component system sensor histidine kinase KdpD